VISADRKLTAEAMGEEAERDAVRRRESSSDDKGSHHATMTKMGYGD